MLGHRVRGRAQKVALTVDADDALFDLLVDALQAGHFAASRERDERRAFGALKRRYGLAVMKAIAIETKSDLATVSAYAEIADRLLFDARAPRDGDAAGRARQAVRLASSWKTSIPACRSCFPAGSMPATLRRRRCASPARAASMSPPASSVRRARRMLIKSAPSWSAAR